VKVQEYVEVQRHAFLSSVLDGSLSSAPHCGHITPGTQHLMQQVMTVAHEGNRQTNRINIINIDNTMEEEIKARMASGNKVYFANKKMFQSRLI